MAENKLGYALITNARIIDGSGKEPYPGHVLLKENRIDSILNDVTDLSKGIILDKTIDAKGQTLMPGLIDAHCHISFDEPSSNDELFFSQTRRPSFHYCWSECI